MLTRCPHCQTRFRVTPEQLKARQGQVRCGACQGVFNALDTLADEPAPAPLPAVAAPEPPDTTDDAPAAATAETADTPPAEESRPWRDGESVADAAESAPLAEATPAPPVEAPPAVPAETPTPPAEAPAADVVAPSQPWDAPPPRPRRWPWALGALLLLALAALQFLFIFRVELAVLTPALRPALAAGCELLGCALPRPRKPELIGIDTSDLVPAGPEHLLLTATLKNRAPFDQEYPHLELTLTDARDAALARKVLAPADYLPDDRPAPAGFAARSELAVRLTVAADGVPAAGYRLYLFYP